MNNRQVITVACPTCKKLVQWVSEQRFKPFCSERCRLIDLGDWATEAHKIPGKQISAEPDSEYGDSEL
ncbi:DNA gyrase inhibitor YacG [Methylomonas sp. LL1]|uniref:DNA gyrase inhibitor YacG n=1 Tax=Methylomonas sp. LL1 TaxID=2785785 RepID=UPI0018C35708|nr:DNA gyrase inhibitor YacG [Methylomonas sp. LL1]QPK62970.1 DNA gyrase inhibitor YacG [Methylomonas sp. LL1]